MKKVSLFLGMVLAASFAMAQNDAKTEQIGYYNKVTVTQSGVNDATTLQYGGSLDAKNVAKVEQIGSNEADLIQGMVVGYWADEVSGSNPNGITTLNMPSYGNNGTIKQNGVNGGATLQQFGNSNTGLIVQKNGSNNTADGYQGWAGDWWGRPEIIALYSNNSILSITQDGTGNGVGIWQYGGTNNKAEIKQTGDNNVGRVSQGFMYADMNYDFTYPVINTENNKALITQSGNLNVAKAFQLGNSNNFTLVQNGNSNSVGKADDGADLLLARNQYFRQDGSFNTFVGEQNGNSTLDNESLQDGNNNSIDLLQGLGDTGLIKQVGDYNDATLKQYGGGQDAIMLQTGISNVASVSQGN